MEVTGITPGAWQGSHRSTNVEVTGITPGAWQGSHRSTNVEVTGITPGAWQGSHRSTNVEVTGITPGAWQGSHRSTNVEVTGITPGAWQGSHRSTNVEVTGITPGAWQGSHMSTNVEDTGITPGAWQGSHRSTNVEDTGTTRPGNRSTKKDGIEPRSTALEVDTLPLGQQSGQVEVVRVCLLVGCLTSRQQASVSQGRVCSDKFTCCHTEIEVADQTFYFTQSQYTDTGPTSPSADPITPGAWQGSHWSANF